MRVQAQASRERKKCKSLGQSKRQNYEVPSECSLNLQSLRNEKPTNHKSTYVPVAVRNVVHLVRPRSTSTKNIGAILFGGVGGGDVVVVCLCSVHLFASEFFFVLLLYGSLLSHYHF